jgi:hypothetical protein
VRAEGVNGRDWEGDSDGGLLVTYRSIGNAKYCPAHPNPRVKKAANSQGISKVGS